MYDHIRQLLEANRQSQDLIGRVDHVTRLPNRLQFLTDYAEVAARQASQSIILVTLAEAKQYNDLLRALGHAYADDFVRAGAARLADHLPAGTTIYHVSVLSFAFFSDEGGSGSPPTIICDIVDAFRDSIRCQDIPVDTKVGIGVTPLAQTAGGGASELLRATLAAAQDSRRTTEGWAWYNRKSDEAHVRAFRLLADLPAAFTADDQLSLHYQPRIDMQSQRCVGAEALIRWTHPVLGKVSPGEFIPLAEATALITPLTGWVMEHALREVTVWQARQPGMKISFNISPRNLDEPDFVDKLEHYCDRANADPRLVELEFTEGCLSANWQVMTEQAARLRSRGFEIAIDDFGSGYSNMANLGSIPAGHLKIDQSFIKSLEHSAKMQVLVRSIIELAHALDFRVVAEGIETSGALDLLSAWDCDEGQGYYVSRPLSDSALAEWLDGPGLIS